MSKSRSSRIAGESLLPDTEIASSVTPRNDREGSSKTLSEGVLLWLLGLARCLLGRGNILNGTYVLLVELSEPLEITVGRLGAITFPAGYCAYVGSALGGLDARLRRHIRSEKKIHWHIDYLLQSADIAKIIVGEADVRAECAIAQKLAEGLDSVRGFGCSDCTCGSHLFLCSEIQVLEKKVLDAFGKAGLSPRSWTDSSEASSGIRSSS